VILPQFAPGAESTAPVAPRPGRRGEKGAELLEFAVVLGALLALMLGIVVFARAYNIYETITRAAREGARMAVLPTAVAASPSNSLDLINTSNACTIPSTTTNTPATATFDNYIKPALEASNLNPNNVKNYQECVGPIDRNNSADADAQCGVVISFQYPDQLTIPFLGSELGTVNIGTNVQMRLENQPAGSCP
jgi:Flp pilus assembly protein TadG